MNLTREVLKHLLGHREIGNHALFERTNRPDVPRGSTEHPLGILPYGGDTPLSVLACLLPHRHH